MTPNRAQRRATARQKTRRVFNKTAAQLTATTLLHKHSTEAQDEQAEIILLTPAYAALDCLLHGSMTRPQLITLMEIVTYAYHLAQRLAEFSANAGTAELLAQCEAPLYAAASLLGDLGAREREEGRFRAGEKEINVLREALRLTGELTAVASQGHTLTALCSATAQVQAVLRRPEQHQQ